MGDIISVLPAASEAIAGGDLIPVTNVSQPGTGETQRFTQDQLLASQKLLAFRTATELTIAADAITVTQGNHKLQPQSGVSDDLKTISGLAAGGVCVLYMSDPGTDTLTIKHGTGNISCSGAADITFSQGALICYSNGTTVFVSGGGGGAKATGAEINTGTDDAKFATPKALRDAGVSKVNAQFQLLCGGIIPATTNGCTAPAVFEMATNKNCYRVPAFNKDTIQYGHFSFELPSDYNGGTITYHVKWAHPATTTNFKVAWALEAVAGADSANADVAFGSAVQVNDTGGNTWYWYFTPESAALTIAGTPLAGKTVNWRLSRVATDATNDTLAVDAYPDYVVITYVRTA